MAKIEADVSFLCVDQINQVVFIQMVILAFVALCFFTFRATAPFDFGQAQLENMQFFIWCKKPYQIVLGTIDQVNA